MLGTNNLASSYGASRIPFIYNDNMLSTTKMLSRFGWKSYIMMLDILAPFFFLFSLSFLITILLKFLTILLLKFLTTLFSKKCFLFKKKLISKHTIEKT